MAAFFLLSVLAACARSIRFSEEVALQVADEVAAAAADGAAEEGLAASSLPAEEPLQKAWLGELRGSALAHVGSEQHELINATGAPFLARGNCRERLADTRHGSGGCLIMKDEKALLVTHKTFKPAGSWDVPGGHLEGDEVSCETAERETCEETRLRVKSLRQLWPWNHIYLCETVATDSSCEPGPEGYLKKRWVTKGEIESILIRDGGILSKAHLETAFNKPPPTPSVIRLYNEAANRKNAEEAAKRGRGPPQAARPAQRPSGEKPSSSAASGQPPKERRPTATAPAKERRPSSNLPQLTSKQLLSLATDKKPISLGSLPRQPKVSGTASPKGVGKIADTSDSRDRERRPTKEAPRRPSEEQ